jgi:thymidylate synthase
MTRFSDTYFSLIEDLLASPYVELNQRTGHGIRLLPGGRSFQIDLREDGQVPVPGNRAVYPKTAAAEIAWYLRGERNLDWMRLKGIHIWDKFAEPNTHTVKNAYGYRWRKYFQRDQIRSAINALQADPTDRQVYVTAWDPSRDGLDAPKVKNVPCPLGFVLNTHRGVTHMHLTIRSSDTFVGLPYDVMGHALLLDAFAAELGMDPGILHVSIAHPHLYTVHGELARTSLDYLPRVDVGPLLPGWSVSQIEGASDEYLENFGRRCSGTAQHTLTMKPELVA